MCNGNKFAVLGEDILPKDAPKNSLVATNKTKQPLLIPKNGFELVISRKNKRKLREGSLEIKSEAELRTEAFSILSDPVKTSQKLKNTKMCIYALKGKKCPRKDCWFAHSEEEFRKYTPCFFGIACIDINNRSKPCKYIHPHETEEEYIQRIKTVNMNDVPELH